MFASDITSSDLNEIRELQPEGWPDILGYINFYINSAFCEPLKFSKDGRIVGMGSAILYKKTCWLAHIIVHKDFRNQGIGSHITKTLVQRQSERGFNTISLIATALGEPVYKKIGFVKETEYQFFKNEHVNSAEIDSSLIVAGRQFGEAILKMDKEIGGEDRSNLLKPHLSEAKACVQKNQLTGFYLPTLGEGLILATDKAFGIELMKVKFSEQPVFIFPKENEAASGFLLDQNFVLQKSMPRMRLGPSTGFKAEMLFNRGGGNIG